MKRTIVRCEACRNVFTGIYTNEGDLVVRGWDGCPKCGETALRDLIAAEPHVRGGDAEGSSTEEFENASADDGTAGESSAGRVDDANARRIDGERPTEEAGDD